MTTSNNQFSGWTEKKLKSTFQSQTCTKKCHSHCVVVCWQSNSLQLSESWQNHAVRQVCSANRRDELKTARITAALVNRKGPVLLHNSCLHVAQPTLQKLNELGYEVQTHPSYSPDPSPTNYHFFKHLYATGINHFISRWQKCVAFNGSYFD